MAKVIRLPAPRISRAALSRPYVQAPPASVGAAGEEIARLFKAARSRSYEGIALPAESDRLLDAITKSRKMLDWADDWDGEGSVGYSEATWNRARDFILHNASRLWRICLVIISTPRISPGPDGSIDIHWKTGESELLINIPVDLSEPATYYGDNKAGQIVKGNLDTQANNQWLLMWLMQ
jgi:hypothetical protein